jgi:hypothetical protein
MSILSKLLEKRYKKAKAVAEPNTAEESIKVKKRLRERYPQMSKPGWGVVKAIQENRKESRGDQIGGSRMMRRQAETLSEGDWNEIKKTFLKKKKG